MGRVRLYLCVGGAMMILVMTKGVHATELFVRIAMVRDRAVMELSRTEYAMPSAPLAAALDDLDQSRQACDEVLARGAHDEAARLAERMFVQIEVVRMIYAVQQARREVEALRERLNKAYSTVRALNRRKAHLQAELDKLETDRVFVLPESAMDAGQIDGTDGAPARTE